MKKLFLVLIAFVGILSFANTNTGGKKPKGGTPPKGTVIINTKDSTVTFRRSDSALAATMIPDGYKLVEKPR